MENRLIKLGEQHSDVLETFMVKPGMVLAKDAGYMTRNLIVKTVMRVSKLMS